MDTAFFHRDTLKHLPAVLRARADYRIARRVSCVPEPRGSRIFPGHALLRDPRSAQAGRKQTALEDKGTRNRGATGHGERHREMTIFDVENQPDRAGSALDLSYG